MRGLFVTGTDTDAGKTIVSACLAAGLRARGQPVRAIKSLATGSAPPGPDAALLGLAGGHAPLVGPCFLEPCAPDRAARLVRERVELAPLVERIRAMAGPHMAIVEGVGGFRVPLNERDGIDDLAVALGLPVVIAAANRLGVLNHALLTYDAVRGRGLPVAGLVLSQTGEVPHPLHAWNAEDLADRLPCPVVRLPHLPRLEHQRLAQEGARLLEVLLPEGASSGPDHQEGP